MWVLFLRLCFLFCENFKMCFGGMLAENVYIILCTNLSWWSCNQLSSELIKILVKWLYLQGTADDIVDFSHGKRLWELSNEKYDPLWIKGGGHCNLETYPEYIKHLRKFIVSMEKLSLVKSRKQNNPPTSTITEVKHNKCLIFGKRWLIPLIKMVVFFYYF